MAGDTLEAEYVKRVGDTVYLRTKEGAIKSVNFNFLVEKDRSKIAQPAKSEKEAASAPVRHLGDRKFGDRPKFGERSMPKPAVPVAPAGSRAAKANAQIAAYREKKAAEDEERRKKSEASKARFAEQKKARERKKRSSSKRR